MIQINLEDLAANAFITLLQNNIEKRNLSYNVLEEYGRKVLYILKSRFNEEARLILSRIETDLFYYKFSKFFTEYDDGVYLKETITYRDLIYEFRGYLSLNLLLSFVDKETVKFLKEIVK